MDNASYIFVELGEAGRVSVNEDKLTVGKSRKLARAVVEVKKKHSALKDYPMLDNETIEEWEIRISTPPKAAESEDKPAESVGTPRKIKEDGTVETTDEYLNRIMDCESDDFDLYFDILNAIYEVVGEKTKRFKDGVTQDAFEEVSVPELIQFFRAIFSRCKIEIDLVFPKRFILPG